MTSISDAFRRAEEERRAALIVYLTAGYPDLQSSVDHMLACVDAGADMLEIGIPFSDPVADGPVIQAASDAALRAGMRPRNVVELIRKLRKSTDVPLIPMGYYNPILQFGEEEFIEEIAAAGANGLIVADLPLEESVSLSRLCRKKRVDLIQLAAPTSGKERIGRIAKASRGYLYLVSRLGTTGRSEWSEEGIGPLIRDAKSVSGGLPVAVGFGISSGSQVLRLVGLGADGVIVGSSIIERISNGEGPEMVSRFVKDLRRACEWR
ncbi:MAG: tryptophan synthase subunit alpha [Methanomassiliicoccales archaeon]|nr:MAG: tryptophan synthase subunit alpha [Methanomassiliicoccales archaeon]